MVERFTFVKHKLTEQKLYVVDVGIIVCRVQAPNSIGFETVEVNEQEVEPLED